MARHLALSLERFEETYLVRKGRRVEMRTEGGHCVFYQGGLCRVHPVKPFHCRRWPLHPAILEDRAAWEAVRSDCPGLRGLTWEEARREVLEAEGG